MEKKGKKGIELLKKGKKFQKIKTKEKNFSFKKEIIVYTSAVKKLTN